MDSFEPCQEDCWNVTFFSSNWTRFACQKLIYIQQLPSAFLGPAQSLALRVHDLGWLVAGQF
jgi:hypothetical protein